MASLVAETAPLFDRLHNLMKSTLSQRYRSDSGVCVPAHWMADPWGQNWTGFIDGSNELDMQMSRKTSGWIIASASDFWRSIGFPPLPDAFWQRSDLLPVPKGTKRRKMDGASLWHIDLQQDVRGLMSVVPNSYWFGAVHHELGHAYYYLSYGIPAVPAVLRVGANRAMHEAIGDLIRLAAFQPRYLRQLGFDVTQQNSRTSRLVEALELSVPLVQFSAGPMTQFEYEIYCDLMPAKNWQSSWWKHVEQFQKIEAPS